MTLRGIFEALSIVGGFFVGWFADEGVKAAWRRRAPRRHE